MKITFAVSALLAAISVTVTATSTWASGYGPAPFYRPDPNTCALRCWHDRHAASERTPRKDTNATESVRFPPGDETLRAPVAPVN